MIVVITVAPLPLQAQSPQEMDSPIGRLPFVGPSSEANMFAYPGTNCPPYSKRYKGPEQAGAAEVGAVYCVIRQRVLIVRKDSQTACPESMKVYNDPKAKPDDDVFWCEFDPNYKPQPPSQNMGQPLSSGKTIKP
jgi:hypothetical protein